MARRPVCSRRPLALVAAFASFAAAVATLSFEETARATVSHPLQIIDRPRTLPGSQFELNGGVELERWSRDNGMGGRDSSTALSAPLGLGYGINNDFEVRAFYWLGLDPQFTGKTALDVRLSYTFFRDSKVQAAAQVRSGVDLGSNDVRPLLLGVNAQYRLTSNFAIFTPGEQLGVGLAGDTHPIWLDLVVGGALQITPQLYGSLTTNLAHIAIANGDSAVILGDMLPVDLAAFYSLSTAADLGAHFYVDLEHTDYFRFGVMARLFF